MDKAQVIESLKAAYLFLEGAEKILDLKKGEGYAAAHPEIMAAYNLEELNMLAQVRRFFEAHAEARFTDWNRPASSSEGHSPRTIQRAGYRKHNTNTVTDGRGEDVIAGTHTEYYVFPETFKQEVCAGFDCRVVCKLLVKRECLMTEDINGKVSYTRKERLPGGEGNMRCYRITHKLFEGSGDE